MDQADFPTDYDPLNHQHTSPSERKGIKLNIDWTYLSKEIFIVVTGVLIAFALNAWWIRSQSNEQEAFYLKRLLVDTKTNRELLVGAIRTEENNYDNVKKIALVVQDTSGTVPVDSLKQWMISVASYTSPSLVSGTLSGLINSGNVSLISNDSLSIQLMNYASTVEEFKSTLRHFEDMQIDIVKGILLDPDIDFFGAFMENIDPKQGKLAQGKFRSQIMVLSGVFVGRIANYERLQKESVELTSLLVHSMQD